MIGPLFSQSAWNNVTFTGGEVRDPGRTLPRALILGVSGVVLLYLLANVAYIVTLTLTEIQHAPQDRVGTAVMEAVLGPRGGDHGRRDLDIDVRLRERPRPGRRACLLRDGQGRALLPGHRDHQPPACPGGRPDRPGRLGVVARAAGDRLDCSRTARSNTATSTTNCWNT